ncbi:MAG TPA: M56 family metallopeptidase, partial [Longimicrobiaceae bacterium]|nr:M56 family metallopeptidase [Longimicrobiaceae bacterium]
MLHLLDSLEAAAHAAAQALLNGLWQGILLTLVIALVLHFLRGTTAATRHAAWFATLLVVLALPLAAASLSPRGAPATAGPLLEERAASADGEARNPVVGNLSLVVPPGSWLLLLLGSGVLVGVARTGRLIHGLRVLRRLKRASRPLPPARYAELEPLCAAHARRRVSLRISDRIATPITVGFLHPAVLVPGTLLEKLSREELAQIVLHELAHIRRGDDWTN